ncbi:MAG: malate synthase A [Deltaproteobacteria bacterium]|nr:MAG: malate synthase A [Deltaproteobacteria bacterium]
MIEVTAQGSDVVFSKPALAFVEELHRAFESRRQELLQKRAERYRKLSSGASFEFLPETAKVRSGDWKVASTPKDLQKRHVEITGPVERKMMINAFNSGADVFMADFEDALSPTWSNIVQGHLNLMDAVRRKLAFTSPEGKAYKLNEKIATLLVRPRGWHLPEKHLRVDGKAIAGAFADFGFFFFHNARETLDRGTGPYFYLPKMESHLEARLWNDVFVLAQEKLGIPRGSVRATVLVETLPAAFEMDEVLYELRDHSSGLNAGRWDYIFSLIKKLRTRTDLILPDRQQVTMTVPFMRAYTELLVKTCHRRGAHAMGGMAPFIPSRKNPEINEKALAQTRADKEREIADGFDGTWVAHPDLVPVAKEVFDRKLGKPNQKERLREEVHVEARELQDTRVPGGTITENGVRNNISVGVQYLASWLSGNGAAAIFNLMEDAATAEISRAQLWQWVQNGAKLADGRKIDRSLYEKFRDEEIGKLQGVSQVQSARKILDQLVLGEFVEFLTLPAYELLE